MNRKTFTLWPLLGLLAFVLFTPLRPIVLSGVQRGLLATSLWKAEVPTMPTTEMPVVLTGGATYSQNLPMVTLDGKAINLSDLKGKVVFVNLWASWCPPCRAEMPRIEALYKKIDKSKVAFVMLSLDDNAAKARKFV